MLSITLTGFGQSPSLTKNHVITKTARIAGMKTDAALDGKSTIEVSTAVSYYDRLNRPDQSIAISASPTGKDLVSFDRYNEYGQPTTTYMPFAVTGSDGSYQTDALSAQTTFYSSAANIGHDTAPWSQVELERSPFKRTLAQGGTGANYQLSEGYKSQAQYTFNTSEDLVFEWLPNEQGDLYLASNAYHPPHALHKQVTKSPEWQSGTDHTSETYTNYLGQKVLTRYYNGTDQFDTYYVYDDQGQLVYIIPPKASQLTRLSDFSAVDPDHVFHASQSFPDHLPLDEVYYKAEGVLLTFSPSLNILPGFKLKPFPEGTTINATNPDSDMAKLVFINSYDHKNRLVSKKTPGAEAIYYVYDQSGRLILSQDGNQRSASQWTFTKYDNKDRPVLTGILTDHRDRDALQTFVEAEIVVGKRYEIRGSDKHGYTDAIWPKGIADDDYLVVSYYDDYDFMDGHWAGFAYDQANAVNNDPCRRYPRGLETGGKVRVLGTDQWLRSVKYYDNDLQLIQGLSDHHRGLKERVYTQYSWRGEVIKTRFEHELSANKTISIEERFVYDHAGRLTEQYHSTDNEPEVLIAQYQYNELGELIEKNLHKLDDGTFVQSVDYRYNIRGQLTHINSSDRTPLSGETDDHPDRFGMQLYYDSAPSGLSFATRTNGHLAGTTWGHADMTGADQRSYGYAYDAVYRLTGATYKEKKNDSWSTRTNHHNVSGISYDLNGNILSLKRNHTNILIDDLDYNYDGNRLVSLDDLTNLDEGFKDGAEQAIEYTYETNGNLTGDANKLITSTTYNILNKPGTITFTNGDHIDYTYDAAGTRLRMSVTTGGTTYVTDYSSGLIFEEDELTHISMPQGRVVVEKVANDSNYDYQYHLSDHLGNIRSTVAPETRVYLATMESDEAISEETQFLHIAETRQLDGANARSGNESARLNPSEGRIIGPAKALKVYAGDVVDLEVFARYLDTDGAVQANSSLLIFDIVASAYGLSASSEAYNALSGTLSGASFLAQSPGDVPAAYLNYIFYDQNYENPLMGHLQISDGAENAFEELTLSYTAPTEGYLYTYVSNESSLDVNVYFDDFKVSHTSAAYVHQADDYYPFGLPISGNKYEDLGNKENRFLYQGKEWQTALALNLYDFHARQYDPATGRFLSNDPRDQFASGYTGMGNNPIIGVDPDGQWVHILVGAIVGAVGNTIVNWDNIDNAWDLFTTWEKGAFVGAAAAFTGGAANAAVTGGTAISGGTVMASGAAATTSFGAGVAAGAAGGFAGGSGNAWTNGANFRDGLSAGAKGAVYGGVSAGLARGIPGFSGVKGGSLANIGAELGHHTLQYGISGAVIGGVDAAIHRRNIMDGIVRGAKTGAMVGAGMGALKIAAYGPAYVPEKSYGNFFKHNGPVYRKGTFISRALSGEGSGVALGRNLVTHEFKEGFSLFGKEVDIARANDFLRAHETAHFIQLRNHGYINFYGRTIREYMRYGLSQVYNTSGTLEYQADQYAFGMFGRQFIPLR
ncbi:DUF6443 domain-containing protein [Reichenbachiella sp.]|uniref:DUF6443 domain-containing protein n=1 Tax=Reichenbachiella sp. TaxID=2184521 RepID=UPI0032980606